VILYPSVVFDAVGGHLSCFQILAIMNNAAMKMVEYVSLQYDIMIEHSLGICPRVNSLFTSTEEWIKNMWYIYTIEYYSAEKNNNIMKFAGKWKELGNIILSEVTQTQKDKPGLLGVEFSARLPPLSYKLDSWSLSWDLAMDLCICFHQSLDKGSTMTRFVKNCVGIFMGIALNL
ncbi:hypothetical protein STEG23_003252, partial [Scotinomys teguina]